MNIIGLGEDGCRVGMSLFHRNEDVYKLYLIDNKTYKGYKTKKIDKQLAPESYEENYKSLKRFFSNLDDKTILILSGQDIITSSCLRMIEELKEKTSVSVLYLMPDLSILSGQTKLHERMIRGILQQYARSTLLERLYIVSMVSVEDIMGPVSLRDFVQESSDTISYYFHMLNYYNNSRTVVSSIGKSIDTAQISTFGVFDLKTKEEKMFFHIDTPREIVYYYGVPEQTIETDLQLYDSVKTHIKNTEAESVSYGIFELTDNIECGIVVKHTSIIQE